MLSQTPPLVVPEMALLDETLRGESLASQSVRLCLDDPIFGERSVARLLSLSAFSDLLFERHLAVAPRGAQLHAQDSNVEELVKGFSSAYPDVKPLDTVRKLGFTQLFPALESVLSRAPTSEDEANQQRPFVDYLGAVSNLNQMLVMAQQLQRDVDEPAGQKYIAHQIALLYQCLNIVRGDTARVLRGRIEQEFETIKKVTESGPSPVLEPRHRAWLNDVAKDVESYAASIPPSLLPRLTPITSLLAKDS